MGMSKISEPLLVNTTNKISLSILVLKMRNCVDTYLHLVYRLEHVLLHSHDFVRFCLTNYTSLNIRLGYIFRMGL